MVHRAKSRKASAALALTFLALASCATSTNDKASQPADSRPTEPARADVRWKVTFDSLKGMTSQSVAVARVSVSDIKELGPTDGKEVVIQYRELHVKVLETYSGSLPSDEATVLQEGRWTFPAESTPSGKEEASAYSPGGMRWARAGDELVVALSSSTYGDGVYRIANPESLYYVEDGVLHASVSAEDSGPLIQSIQGATPSEFAIQVKEAT
jgi:hypothetical protein